MSSEIDPELLNALVDVESLYQEAPCGYLSFFPDGTLIKVNRTLLSWLGYEECEVAGLMNIKDLLSGGGQIYYQTYFNPLLYLNGKVNEINFTVYRKDRSTFPALINASIVRDNQGKMIAVNAVINDITDRKKYESELLGAKKLAEAEKIKFEFVSDYIPELIWAANEEGRIYYFNKRLIDHFKTAFTENKTAALFSVIHPEDKMVSLRNWVQGIHDGKDFEIQMRLRSGEGAYEWYLLKGVPYYASEGQIARWLGSCLNINNHVLEVEKRDEFISIASHELKTPVTTLKMALQLLDQIKEAPPSPLLKTLIDQSNKGINKLTLLIEELLDVNRLTEGQLSINRAPYNIFDMLEDCCTEWQMKGTFQLDLTGETGLIVEADELRIEQVVINFLNNAQKYAPDSMHIQVKVERLQQRARISVTDFGPGIPSEKQSHVFERYYRADHNGQQYSGLGLGLYISAGIIRKNNGEIGVFSEPGSGSTFWFTLPLALQQGI